MKELDDRIGLKNWVKELDEKKRVSEFRVKDEFIRKQETIPMTAFDVFTKNWIRKRILDSTKA